MRAGRPPCAGKSRPSGTSRCSHGARPARHVLDGELDGREGSCHTSPRGGRRRRGRSRRTRSPRESSSRAPAARPGGLAGRGRGGRAGVTGGLGADVPMTRAHVGTLRPAASAWCCVGVGRPATRVPDRGSDTWLLEDRVRSPRRRDPDLRLRRPGRRARSARDLRRAAHLRPVPSHAERLTAPRGWEVVRVGGEFAEPALAADDLLALADAVREAGRPAPTRSEPSARRDQRRPGARRGRPTRAPAGPAVRHRGHLRGVRGTSDAHLGRDLGRRRAQPRPIRQGLRRPRARPRAARRRTSPRRSERRSPRSSPSRTARTASSSGTTCVPARPTLSTAFADGVDRARRRRDAHRAVLHRRALLRERRARTCPVRCSPPATTRPVQRHQAVPVAARGRSGRTPGWPRSATSRSGCSTAARACRPPATGRARVSERDLLADYAALPARRSSTSSGIRPLKVVVDAGNGMGGHTVPPSSARRAGLTQLPLEIVPLYFELDGTFPNHEANPLDPANLVDLQEAVVEHGADIGLAFDGDADRCFVVDGDGEPVVPSADHRAGRDPRDRQGSAPAATRRGRRSCTTSSRRTPSPRSSPSAAPRRCAPASATPSSRPRWPAHGAVFGGEHSAHYYFRDFWFADTGMLAALHVLAALGEQDGPLSRARRRVTSATSPPARSTPRVDDQPAVVEPGRGVGARARGRSGRRARRAAPSPHRGEPMWWFNVRAVQHRAAAAAQRRGGRP